MSETPATSRTSSPSSSSTLDRHKDRRTTHRFHSVLVSCRPDSILPGEEEGPAGSTLVAAAHTAAGAVHSLGRLAGRGWASCRSSRYWEGPADMAACRPGCMGRHHGGSEGETEGIAAVRPVLQSVMRLMRL